jgi:hypothetical protein
LTIVNIVYFYMYVYSFLGRAWGIDWLTCRWNIHVLFSSNCTYLCKIPMN